MFVYFNLCVEQMEALVVAIFWSGQRRQALERLPRKALALGQKEVRNSAGFASLT